MSYGDDQRDYRIGRSGGSPLTADNTFAWAQGDAERKLKETLDTPLKGEAHPNAWQIFIIAGAVAAAFRVLFERGLVPSVLTDTWWSIGGIWLVVTTALYFILKALPNWLSGTLMGLALGALSGFAASFYLGLMWSAGIALGTGALMYYLFSRLN